MSRLAEATRIAESVRRDPEEAHQAAIEFIDQHGEATDDPAALAEAHRARGTARRMMRNLDGALKDFDTGVDIAEASGQLGIVGRILTSRSVVFVEKSQPERAFADLDRAEQCVEDNYRGIYLVQRASVYARLKPDHDPMIEWDQAIPYLEQHDQHLYLADLYRNSGIFLGYVGRVDESVERIRKALRIYEQIGAETEAATSFHSLGWAESMQGEVGLALKSFETARLRLDYDSRAFLHLAVDYANTLLSVGLAVEAQQISADAATRLVGHDSILEAGRAFLGAGVAALHAGDDHAAADFAARATEAFDGSDAGPWQSLAQYLELRTRSHEVGQGPNRLASATRIADELAEWGWTSNAHHARLFAVDQCLLLGQLEGAKALLAQATDSTESALEVQIHRWLSVARLREAEGDPGAAMRACHNGIDLISHYRDSLGSIDLRCHLMSFADGLRSQGLKLALQAGRAERVLAWNEKCTATAFLSPPLTATDDRELKEHLAELRRIAARLETQASTDGTLAPLYKRQAALRDLIRRRARIVDPHGEASERPTVGALKAQLRRSTLIELIVSGDHVHGLVVEAERTRLAPNLCTVADLDVRMNTIRVCVAELFDARPSRLSDAVAQLHRAATEIDELLMGRLRVTNHHVVLVPSPQVSNIPWSLLTTLRGRSITIAPSATSWCLASERTAAGSTTVAVAGSNLTHADSEVEMVCGIRNPAVSFTTKESEVAPVLQALESAATVHFACHCRLRAGNPLFSQLDLGDGPLFAYDLLELKRTPHLVILSACESGRDEATGHELLGLTSSLLARETASVIASMYPLPDTPHTVRALEIVHRRLDDDASPSEAVAAMVAALDLHDPQQLLVAVAINCYGVG